MFYWVKNQKNLKRWFPNSKAYLPDDAISEQFLYYCYARIQGFFLILPEPTAAHLQSLQFPCPHSLTYVNYDTIRKAKKIHLAANSVHYRTTSSQASVEGLGEVLDERGNFFLASTNYFSTVKSYMQVCPLNRSMISFHHVRNNMWITQESFNI